ncbi:hypothetical protein NADE_001720 [Nannochloris sp. 'desiccata']|nr:hypothetical protein NADE_001720 [Chlorella desiccata (nom. nud.)]
MFYWCRPAANTEFDFQIINKAMNAETIASTTRSGHAISAAKVMEFSCDGATGEQPEMCDYQVPVPGTYTLKKSGGGGGGGSTPFFCDFYFLRRLYYRVIDYNCGIYAHYMI